MKAAATSFGSQLKALREAAGFTQEELATIAGLSVHAISALERGERRRPHVETVRALSAALDLAARDRDALLAAARAPVSAAAVDELGDPPLPAALTALVGRDADLHTLRQWLADPTPRLITLTGPGGAGKTRLALELGHAIAAERAARVVFVPLAGLRNAAFVAPTIAEAFGLSDVSAIELSTRVRVASDGRPTLLLLDNFEHVLDAATVVADLLLSVPLIRVLATSRAALRLRGEREYAVGPLALNADAPETSPADLVRVPAIRLFVERVRDVRPDFRLTPANGGTVTAICRRLDALPLAIELAAPWMKTVTLEHLLGRLTDDVLLASVPPRDLPQRQQTMNATVAWSYHLLTSDEQRAFRRFGALPSRFPIEAAAAVLAGADDAVDGDSALHAVAGLIDKSLVQRADTSVTTRPLYQMLETVRAYAALALTEAGERDAAMEGLTRYAMREASLAGEALVGPAQVEWLHRVREDLETYRATLTWLIERDRPAAAEILWGLMAFWLVRGRLAEGLGWYEKTLNMRALPPAAESRSLVGAALMWYTQRELDRAAAALQRALVIAQQTGDIDVLVTADNLLGYLEYAVGDLGSARERHARSLAIYRELAVPWGIGNALAGLAGVALAAGHFQDAERLIVEATTVLRGAGPWFLTPVMYFRAVLALQRGEADEAIALVRESLSSIRELQDKFAFVYALVALAAAAVQKGENAWAARILGTGDAVTARTGATVADNAVEELRQRTQQVALERLGPAAWARAHAEGRLLSIDAVINEIDSR